MNDKVSDYINALSDDKKEIMNEIRKLILQSVPNVKEDIKWGRPVFSAERDFAYLKPAKNYVSLGFFHFAKLDDPENLLEGTGKDMRHIKIKRVGDINEKLLKKWFKDASK